MIDVKAKRKSIMLTSAPCSTKNLIISVDSILIAILRGQSLKLDELYNLMIVMKIKVMILNKDKYLKKENLIKQ